MCKIIGQTKLINNINSLIDNKKLSHTILILGDYGSGKHTLANYIADKMYLNITDITNAVSDEVIAEINAKTYSSIYLIDLDKINEKQQNILLKFIEEPNILTYIILIAKNNINLLSTICNRCFIINMLPYSKEELKTFTTDEVALELLDTPGKIINTNINTLLAMKELCSKIILKIKEANYTNTMSIVNKINFKDEYDKFDCILFLDTLIKTCLEMYGDLRPVIYKILIKYRKYLDDNRINKQYIMETILSEMWREIHDYRY